jgi:hypothetical protein
LPPPCRSRVAASFYFNNFENSQILEILISGKINVIFLINGKNMGVACGPGFPFQVLALPSLKGSAHCGLYTSIPNATFTQPNKNGAISSHISSN